MDKSANNQPSEYLIDSCSDHQSGEKLFGEAISKLIENKFNINPATAALERKPKADKGV